MDRRAIARPEEPEGTTPIFLSLYLIILAFFILLNAISKLQEERTKVVLGSLGATFAEPAFVATGPLDFTAGSGAFSAVQTFDQSIRKLFQSAFPFVSFKPFQPFEKMIAEIPVDAMFSADSALIRADQVAFLNDLAAILSRETKGQTFGVEILAPVSAQAMREPTSQRTMAVDRVGAFARAMAARGVLPTRITSGIEQGKSEMLRLLFFAEIAEDAEETPTAGDG